MSTRIGMDDLRRINPKHPLVKEADAAHAEAVAQGQEGAFQTSAETWLIHAGYFPRTQKMINGGPPPKGWYIHTPKDKAKGSPIILDLLLLGDDGRWLELELKTSVGRVSKEQKALLAQDPVRRKLCRNLREVIDAVREWEAAANPDAPDRVSVSYMHDNCTFTALDLSGGVSYLLVQARQLGMESPHGMLCPVTLLRDQKEVRRLKESVHSDRDGLGDTTAWEAEVRADADVMRLLEPARA